MCRLRCKSVDHAKCANISTLVLGSSKKTEHGIGKSTANFV